MEQKNCNNNIKRVSEAVAAFEEEEDIKKEPVQKNKSENGASSGR